MLEISTADEQNGKRPIQPLRAGELVVTHGVVEMKAAFEALSTRDRIEVLQLRGK